MEDARDADVTKTDTSYSSRVETLKKKNQDITPGAVSVSADRRESRFQDPSC